MYLNYENKILETYYKESNTWLLKNMDICKHRKLQPLLDPISCKIDKIRKK